MTCDNTDERVTVGGMRKQFECGKQSGRNQQWLGNRGVPDGLGVGFGAVMPQIKA